MTPKQDIPEDRDSWLSAFDRPSGALQGPPGFAEADGLRHWSEAGVEQGRRLRGTQSHQELSGTEGSQSHGPRRHQAWRAGAGDMRMQKGVSASRTPARAEQNCPHLWDQGGSGFPQVENRGGGYTGVTWEKPPLRVPPYSAS